MSHLSLPSIFDQRLNYVLLRCNVSGANTLNLIEKALKKSTNSKNWIKSNNAKKDWFGVKRFIQNAKWLLMLLKTVSKIRTKILVPMFNSYFVRIWSL